jgi:hypothetical protein
MSSSEDRRAVAVRLTDFEAIEEVYYADPHKMP